MIVALDIETVANPEAVARMPAPEVKTGNIKDPAKIAAKHAEAKAEQMSKAALNPLTARVVCYAAVGIAGVDEAEFSECASETTDEAERGVVQSILEILGQPEMRLVTWNGIGFDLPMIYKRAMLLGVDPSNFGAPPLPAWTKRYNTDKHYDLMQVWGGWSEYAKLDSVGGMILGENKTEINVEEFAEMMKTEKGRGLIVKHCLECTNMTWRLWKRFNGVLFQ